MRGKYFEKKKSQKERGIIGVCGEKRGEGEGAGTKTKHKLTRRKIEHWLKRVRVHKRNPSPNIQGFA